MQHSVAPNGRRADLAGLWHAAQPVAGRHRASATSRRRALGIAVALLVGLAAVGHVGWLVLTHSNAAPRPYPAFTRTQRHSAAAADDWIRANLATGIRLPPAAAAARRRRARRNQRRANPSVRRSTPRGRSRKPASTDLVYGPTPLAALRLITCTGSFDRATHDYSENLIVTAYAV
jgi:hypothetical protein